MIKGKYKLFQDTTRLTIRGEEKTMRFIRISKRPDSIVQGCLIVLRLTLNKVETPKECVNMINRALQVKHTFNICRYTSQNFAEIPKTKTSFSKRFVANNRKKCY